MNQANNLRKSTTLISVLSILPHLLCCGIPAVAAIVSLGSTVGFTAALAGSPLYETLDAYHTQLLTLAIAGVTISGIFNLAAYRIDCREAACTHAPCKPRKLSSFRIFLISLALLMVDLAWFYTEGQLGLHDDSGHHGHNHHDH